MTEKQLSSPQTLKSAGLTYNGLLHRKEFLQTIIQQSHECFARCLPMDLQLPTDPSEQ